MAEMPCLETEQLLLRPVRESDADAIFEIFGNDEVMRFYDKEAFTTPAQAEQLLSRMIKRNAEGETMRWGITLKENDTVIGTAGFNVFVMRWARGGIGYDILPAYGKQGYMTEALRAILQYSFTTLGLNRVEAMVMPGNEASAGLLRKLGFHREGLLREYGFWKNEFQDLQMFALLKREWSEFR